MNTFRALFILAVIATTGFVRGGNQVVFADGTPGWSIKNKQCTFNVGGRILNESPQGSLSGSLRLVLWVTANPFPSTGYRVATYDLGQLAGGFQYSNINPVTSCSLPKLTGNYYFTVALEQYSDGDWALSDSAPSSVKTLKNGIFTKPKSWKAPAGKIITPRKSLMVGENLNLTLQGSQSGGALVYVPNGSQLRLRVRIEANGQTTVFGGSKPQGAPALYTYTTSRDKSGTKTSPVGSIALDYGYFFGVESTSTYSLFFQQKNKGFYKGVDTDQGFSGTSWGIFSIN
jgi:hypothetical protein